MSRDPILLLSLMPRCGSNFLEALLGLHPHCRKSRVPEDFFLANGATLLRFCRTLTESWEQLIGGEGELAACLGEALLRFAEPAEAAAEGPCRLLLRSPTSEGLDAAAALFSRARIVLLVRDGPATVESGRRSFGWWYEEAMLTWRDSARRALAFLGNGAGRCLLVRFEDLAAAPVCEMAKILGFLALDEALYPFDRVADVPVLGSSSFGRDAGQPVHWDPVPKGPGFDPLRRAVAWPRRRLKRFSWLAGPELRRFGYETTALGGFDKAANVALDLWHLGRRIVVRLAVLRHARPAVFGDRQRRYLSWRHIRIVT
ncbi:MAG TPA: sulfotransferase [Stellaceae bacterium]|nr:sulfotransferase [Stellaceae bacterium]